MKTLLLITLLALSSIASGQECLSTSQDIYLTSIKELVETKADIFKKAKQDGVIAVFRQEGLGLTDSLKIILLDSDTIEIKLINERAISLLMTNSKNMTQWFIDIEPIRINGDKIKVTLNNGIYFKRKKEFYSHVDEKPMLTKEFKLKNGSDCWIAVDN